jgi:uncharacterized membrane protein
MTSQPTPPPQTAHDTNDQATEKMELALGMLLRAGVALSIALILLGLLVSFIRHPNFIYDQHILHTLVTSEAEFPNTVSGVFKALTTMPGRAIIDLGLLVLLATPIIRVAVSAIVFGLRKDWPFTFLTTLVFFTLILSLLLGKTE